MLHWVFPTTHLMLGVVKALVEVVKTAQKEKVVRVGLLSLRNLLAEPGLGLASDMMEAGLPKVVTTRGMQVSNFLLCK